MNRHQHKLISILIAVSLSCLSVQLWAQPPFYGAVPGYAYTPGYQSWYPDYYAPYHGYGYLHPRWQVRGYINRYGDYQFDVKLRNISKQDMYRAWLMYRAYGGQ